MEPFQVTLDLKGQVAVAGMQGDLTHTSEGRLIKAYERACAANAKYFVLDFRLVEYINSAGMSVIISILTQAQEAGREIRACGLSAHFQKIFDMVGLSKYIRHFENAAAATEDLAGNK